MTGIPPSGARKGTERCSLRLACGRNVRECGFPPTFPDHCSARFVTPPTNPPPTKPCETLCLGWSEPLLPRCVALLRDRFADPTCWDLEPHVCVLPSTRAVQRFHSLLQQEAEQTGVVLRPPQVITVGQLPELLYQSQALFATEFEQTLAWAQVLRAAGAAVLAPLVPIVPPPEPIGPWLELASTLRRLHEDLSSNQLTFADVIDVAETDNDRQRWDLLRRLFDHYLARIESAGLSDPHSERRQAVLSGSCRTEKTVVLIGTTDLNASMTAMLRSVIASNRGNVISLIAAPSSEAHRFDELGSVETSLWLDHQLPLDDDQLIAAGSIDDQAVAVTEFVSDLATRFSADQITVGVTDESHVGPVEVELRGCGFSSFRHLGWTVPETSIGRLLSLTTTYLQRRSWKALAALVRHADVHSFLSRRLEQHSPTTAWLTDLDRLLADHYPVRVRDPLPRQAIKDHPTAAAVGEQVEQWLSVFSGADRSIAAWSKVIGAWFDQLYPDGDQSLSNRTSMSLAAVRRLTERYGDLNDQLDFHVSGSVAMETLLGRLSETRVSGSPNSEHVEILGWLDLALDDAPALTVIGMNHPFVPAATTSDPFLPGSLRTRLQMGDNDRRFARDVYAMQVMLSARAEVRFIVGKSGADRSPTPPSGLLAAASRVDLARRVRRLLGKRRDAVVVPHRWDEGGATELPIAPIPRAGSEPVVQSMSVTAFHDYLICPYRFYLRHVLKIKPLDDASSELAANQFGDLVHAALENFGRSDDRHETNQEKIEALLIHHLDQHAALVYGDSASTAVSIQVGQARRRLQVVAARQAQRIADGWKIHATEASVGKAQDAGIDVDGKRMALKGRFDRIDRHSDGRWAILDYKTHGHRPEKKHLRNSKEGEQWIDLQLPLYRMMIPFLGIDVPPPEVQLGYFNIAEKADETRINIAEFTEPQMKQADELIHDCIRRIWSGDFEPTDDRVPFDDYGMILQTGVANRLLDQAELDTDEAGT